jgi:hypothetical protein
MKHRTAVPLIITLPLVLLFNSCTYVSGNKNAINTIPHIGHCKKPCVEAKKQHKKVVEKKKPTKSIKKKAATTQTKKCEKPSIKKAQKTTKVVCKKCDSNCPEITIIINNNNNKVTEHVEVKEKKIKIEEVDKKPKPKPLETDKSFLSLYIPTGSSY